MSLCTDTLKAENHTTSKIKDISSAFCLNRSVATPTSRFKQESLYLLLVTILKIKPRRYILTFSYVSSPGYFGPDIFAYLKHIGVKVKEKITC